MHCERIVFSAVWYDDEAYVMLPLASGRSPPKYSTSETCVYSPFVAKPLICELEVQ